MCRLSVASILILCRYGKKIHSVCNTVQRYNNNTNNDHGLRTQTNLILLAKRTRKGTHRHYLATLRYHNIISSISLRERRYDVTFRKRLETASVLLIK